MKRQLSRSFGRNKIGHMYIITKKGISTKLTQTYGFLQRKLDEFERLKRR